MITKFFIWCSGAKSEVLEICPIEKGKFVGMGMAVFFVSLLSVVSSTFFITYAFANKATNNLEFVIEWKYIASGILWGLIIFTLDRNIIASIRKTGNFKEELQKAYPRILLAVFIGIIISTPLEMKFFEKEITQNVEDSILSQQQGQKNNSVAPSEDEIRFLKDEISKSEKLRDKEFNEAIKEKNGTGLSGVKRYGPLAKEHEKKSNVYAAQADSLRRQLSLLSQSVLLSKNEINIDTLYKRGIIQKFDGADLRIHALYTLGWFHWVITLLFITLELLPLLVKLMTPKGPYDEVLDRIEYEYYIDQKRIISDKNSEINHLLTEINDLNKLKGDVRIKVEKARLDIELVTNESLLKEIAEKQAALAKIAIKKWYQDEQAKLKESTGYNFAKTKPDNSEIVPVQEKDVFVGTLWKATNLRDEVYFLFKNGKSSDNEVVYFESGKMTKGLWDYTVLKNEIKIDLSNNLDTYSIKNLSVNSVDLESKNSGEINLIQV